jgi:TolA-binding protein
VTIAKSANYAFMSVAIAASLASVPAIAQRQQPSPEDRIERLERQVQQMQRTVFPKGRPADTAGFSTEPAATQSAVTTLAQRLDALERQMSDLVRQVEESGNRMRQIDDAITQLRNDQSRRIDILESKLAAAASAPPIERPADRPTDTPIDMPPAKAGKASKPTAGAGKLLAITPAKPSATGDAAPSGTPADDPAELAYTVGYKQWSAGDYDSAIASLRDFVKAYPNHRRTSFANNLIGRALLDKGDAQAAVQAFVANYNGNPAGERAADSLYYLGQALVALGQPAQACNAYAELEKVFGESMRADLRKLTTEAESNIACK